MKRIFYITFLLVITLLPSAFSQEKKESPFAFGADFFNRYIWRGVNLGGNTPSIQPNINFNFGSEKHAFSLGTFGAYSVGGQQLQEADLLVTYTYNEILKVSVTDYFFPSDDGSSPNYLNYKDKETGHVFEGLLQFNGTEKIPFSLMFAMNFYGADARKINNDGTDGGIVMSKYLELGYTKEFSDMRLSLFLGSVLDNPDTKNGEIGFYGNQSYGVINVGCKLSKEVKITEHFSLPLQSQLIINPESNRIFMVFGITF